MPTPTRSIDHALRMFYANANGEGLGLHVHTALVQQGEGVARTVAQSQHHMSSGQVRACACVAIFHVQASDLPALRRGFNVDVDHTLFKTHFTTHGNDLLSQVFHHLDQFKSANVGVCCKQDIAGRARLHKFVHDLAA